MSILIFLFSSAVNGFLYFKTLDFLCLEGVRGTYTPLNQIPFDVLCGIFCWFDSGNFFFFFWGGGGARGVVCIRL